MSRVNPSLHFFIGGAMKNLVCIRLDSVVFWSSTITTLSVTVLFNLVYFCVVCSFSVFVAVLSNLLYFFVVVITGNCLEFRPMGVIDVVVLHFIVPLIRIWCLQLELLFVDVWCTWLAYNVVTTKVNNKTDNFIVIMCDAL
jgi:hypothetical protein